MKNLIYSISEIFDNAVLGDVEKYVIPCYQRGYKWNNQCVKKLLSDIDRFELHGDEDKFYCLNNITVVEVNDNGKKYNVVDGQQRLTTIIVVLSYLKRHDAVELPKFEDKFEYAIRPITQDFLSTFLMDSKENDDFFRDSWEDFERKIADGDKSYDFQDIYYLYGAYQTVMNWFEKDCTNKENFVKKFLSHTKLIVNLVPNVKDECELFGNLNSHKVPLDGADLVRALIITNVAKELFVDDELETVKQIVQINEERTRIGLLIDDITRWWKDAKHSEYFSSVVKYVSVDKTNNIQFDEQKYPINYLLKLYVIIYGEGTIRLEVFDKKNKITDIWKNLLELQRTIESWYSDWTIYHLVKYIIEQGNIDNKEKYNDIFEKKDAEFKNPTTIFKELYEEWTRKTKKGFHSWLRKTVKKILEYIDEDKTILDVPDNDLTIEHQITVCKGEDWYNRDGVKSLMILLDIISLEKNQEFLDPELFIANGKNNKEDKEHIFPQTPISDSSYDAEKRKKMLHDYIKLLNKNIDDHHPDMQNEKINDFSNDNDVEYNEAASKVEQLAKKLIPINALGNICLLASAINRQYHNDFFSQKRIAIQAAHHNNKKIYIRPHVLEAFNKVTQKEYDSTKLENVDLKEWGETEIAERRLFIVIRINEFLRENA